MHIESGAQLSSKRAMPTMKRKHFDEDEELVHYEKLTLSHGNASSSTSDADSAHTHHSPRSTSVDLSPLTRRGRTLLRPDQTDLLVRFYDEASCTPCNEDVSRLAAQLGLPENKIKVWFASRRSRLGRKEAAKATLPAAVEALDLTTTAQHKPKRARRKTSGPEHIAAKIKSMEEMNAQLALVSEKLNWKATLFDIV